MKTVTMTIHVLVPYQLSTDGTNRSTRSLQIPPGKLKCKPVHKRWYYDPVIPLTTMCHAPPEGQETSMDEGSSEGNGRIKRDRVSKNGELSPVLRQSKRISKLQKRIVLSTKCIRRILNFKESISTWLKFRLKRYLSGYQRLCLAVFSLGRVFFFLLQTVFFHWLTSCKRCVEFHFAWFAWFVTAVLILYLYYSTCTLGYLSTNTL
jgi:hypothetical protein